MTHPKNQQTITVLQCWLAHCNHSHSTAFLYSFEPIAASTRMNPYIAFGCCKRAMPLHVHGCVLKIWFKVFHCMPKVPPLLKWHNCNANYTAFWESLTAANTCMLVLPALPMIRMTCWFLYVNTWQIHIWQIQLTDDLNLHVNWSTSTCCWQSCGHLVIVGPGLCQKSDTQWSKHCSALVNNWHTKLDGFAAVWSKNELHFGMLNYHGWCGW